MLNLGKIEELLGDKVDSLLNHKSKTICKEQPMFQVPMKDGVEVLKAIQDVYLNKKIDIA